MAIQMRQENRFPWEVGQAAPADRALGLELELIELVRRHDDITDPTDPEARDLAREILEVQAELEQVAAHQPMAV